MGSVNRAPYAIGDGTLTSIDLVVEQKCYYSGKHKRHGVNIQVLADSTGPLVWTSPARSTAWPPLAPQPDRRACQRTC